MAKTFSAVTTLLASQSLAAGATVRSAVLDGSAVDGGIITIAITTGGTGPTAQCEARVLMAHAQVPAPAAAAEGVSASAWKRVAGFGGGTASGATTRYEYVFGPERPYLCVEFTGNTGQAVTVEAYATTYTYP